MLHVTDRWGDVPYKEAFKGPANNKPKFDSQQSIYNDLLKELKEAVGQITAGLPNDPLFDGNFNRWKSWGQSLRAIIALRMAKTGDAALAKTAFNEAVTGGLMASNADNAIFKYLSNSNFESPWYTNYVRQGRYDYGTSATVIDMLNANHDPRLPVFARPAINTGNYVGLPYGEDAYYDVADFSLLGRAYLCTKCTAAINYLCPAMFYHVGGRLKGMDYRRRCTGWPPGMKRALMPLWTNGRQYRSIPL